VGPRAGLDTEARGKTLCPRRGSKPGRQRGLLSPNIIKAMQLSGTRLGVTCSMHEIRNIKILGKPKGL
jgi:hypothetical protein